MGIKKEPIKGITLTVTSYYIMLATIVQQREQPDCPLEFCSLQWRR